MKKSWVGVGFGAGLGYALGGPLGALVGAWIGHKFSPEDEKREREHALTEEEVKQLFQDLMHAALFGMLAKMAKADGRVVKAEAEVINRFAREALEMDETQRRAANRVFRQALEDDRTIYDYADDFYQLFDGEDEESLREAIYALLFEVAMSDGHLAPEEREILERLPAHLHISRTLFDVLLHQHTNGTGITLAEAREILGVSEDADEEEIKRAYRRKVQDYHPDVLASMGLPEDMMRYAEERFRRIQMAYEILIAKTE